MPYYSREDEHNFASDNKKEQTMKRYILTLIAVLTIVASASAMSYQRAREEALYLTDKMAYELNLNDQQYNDAYEINLDYFLSMNSERDLYEDYLSYRLTDFRHILLNWQFDLMLQADYFVRPLVWNRGCWVFPIYSHYHRGVFYYDRPHVYFEYRGGHGHHHFHDGYYADRRPRWDGGMRGREPMGRPGRGEGRVNPGRGDGYHFDLPGQGGREPRRDGQPGRDNNGFNGGRDGRPERDGNNGTVGREERPGRGSYERETTRGNYSSGRGNGQTTRGNGYTRTDRGSYSRQGVGTDTRSYDRTHSTPSRTPGTSTRSGSGSQPYDRGNSFSRSSSRATTGGGSPAGYTRGGGMSRGSSSVQSRGGSGSPATRGGAATGGTISRGRR